MVLERPSPNTRVAELLRMLDISKQAYERAYDKTRNRGLRDLYGFLASSRIGMMSELEGQLALLHTNGEFVATRGNRGWSQIWKQVPKPTWLLGDDAVLNTIYRSESRLLSIYDRNLLMSDLPETLVDALGRQRVQVLENVSNISLFLGTGIALANQ